MNEQLLRIDVSNVKTNVYKFLYKVPEGSTFVVSRIHTTSADIVKLKINWHVITESRKDNTSYDSFFDGLVLNGWDEVLVTHALAWTTEFIAMSGSLVTNI